MHDPIGVSGVQAVPNSLQSVGRFTPRKIAPHSQAVLVIRTLDPGEYPFFDDFHPDAPQAVVVAREKP